MKQLALNFSNTWEWVASINNWWVGCKILEWGNNEVMIELTEDYRTVQYQKGMRFWTHYTRVRRKQ